MYVCVCVCVYILRAISRHIDLRAPYTTTHVYSLKGIVNPVIIHNPDNELVSRLQHEL